MNYYNDFDKKACAWLRELIKAGEIPDGIVDDRSITDVTANDLRGFTQCHFFAGIGGWSLALQLAGWPADRNVWTGSCPCQPFSVAGKGDGKSDERHLWPAFARLIAECRPPVVFGEQVESAIKHGWIDDLQADMEREDYAVGFAVLGAHSVGAPHIRQRLYWVANAELQGHHATENRGSIRKKQEEGGLLQSEGACDADRLANGLVTGREGRLSGREDTGRENQHRRAGCNGAVIGLADSNGEQAVAADQRRFYPKSLCDSDYSRVANSRLLGSSRSGKQAAGGEKCCGIGGLADADGSGLQPGERDNPSAGYGDSLAATGGDDRPQQPREADGCWDAVDWLFCRDGKWRPVEPCTFPLANGVPERVGLLRGYGNAIVPQAAAEFVKAFMEVNK